MNNDDGRNRVVIESVTPEIDCGTFAIKRVPGEVVVVEANVFTDGHDAITTVLRYREANEESWNEVPMEPTGNDRWRGSFTVSKVGQAHYTIDAWVDHFKSWVRDMAKRIEAGAASRVDTEIGTLMIESAQARTSGIDARRLAEYVRLLRTGEIAVSQDIELSELMHQHAERAFVTSHHELPITVDRELAEFSSWYEIFPRSTSTVPGQHGTFKDVEALLPYVAEMGFDILYMVPIHPIGQTFRKGKDNSPSALPGEPGSPYAIGSEEGGHKSIHSELGTLEDFQHLVQATRAYGMEIALDNAFQCSPDHPYVKEHPEWFRERPDGTIQYAENPPKKYQDIYPINFESEDWWNLWQELKSYFDFWIEQGVRVFRVDNPHTKAFSFWEWCIPEIKREHPDVIFLSEAFTRPNVMYRLAKLGFTQSYTYFAWRTEKWELAQYMIELTQTPVREYFRPNFWPTTHDILTPQFYEGHRSTFVTRLVMAATMSASYGIYGPAYELMQHTPAGTREEYIDNEKYELRTWDLDDPNSLRPFIAQLNRIRRENLALHRNDSIRFHTVQRNYAENDQIIAYTKQSPDGSNIILVVANLDPVQTQTGWVHLPLHEFGLNTNARFVAHDLMTDIQHSWTGEWNYVELNPQQTPAHIFRIERVRTERDFEPYR